MKLHFFSVSTKLSHSSTFLYKQIQTKLDFMTNIFVIKFFDLIFLLVLSVIKNLECFYWQLAKRNKKIFVFYIEICILIEKNKNRVFKKLLFPTLNEGDKWKYQEVHLLLSKLLLSSSN